VAGLWFYPESVHSRGSSFLLPPLSRLLGLRVRKRRRTWRGKSPPPDSNPYSDAEFVKISLARQTNSPHMRIADSNSMKAVSFSSARTMKRLPSPRCASAIQLVPPHCEMCSACLPPTSIRIVPLADCNASAARHRASDRAAFCAGSPQQAAVEGKI
jgi:hypothetical protein